MSEFRPCPFCGGDHITFNQSAELRSCEIYCKQCRGSMWYGTLEGAKELWNRRPDPAPLVWGDGPPDKVGLWMFREPSGPVFRGVLNVRQDALDSARSGDSHQYWYSYQWAGPLPEPQEPGETP